MFGFFPGILYQFFKQAVNIIYSNILYRAGHYNADLQILGFISVGPFLTKYFQNYSDPSKVKLTFHTDCLFVPSQDNFRKLSNSEISNYLKFCNIPVVS